MSRMFLVRENPEESPTLVPGDYPWAKIEELDPAGRWVTKNNLIELMHDLQNVSWHSTKRKIDELFSEVKDGK